MFLRTGREPAGQTFGLLQCGERRRSPKPTPRPRRFCSSLFRLRACPLRIDGVAGFAQSHPLPQLTLPSLVMSPPATQDQLTPSTSRETNSSSHATPAPTTESAQPPPEGSLKRKRGRHGCLNCRRKRKKCKSMIASRKLVAELTNPRQFR